MKNYIILLDGPKGAGKTMTGSLLSKKLLNTDFLSLDNLTKGYFRISLIIDAWL